jgi:hypothetical protein
VHVQPAFSVCNAVEVGRGCISPTSLWSELYGSIDGFAYSDHKPSDLRGTQSLQGQFCILVGALRPFCDLSCKTVGPVAANVFVETPVKTLPPANRRLGRSSTTATASGASHDGSSVLRGRASGPPAGPRERLIWSLRSPIESLNAYIVKLINDQTRLSLTMYAAASARMSRPIHSVMTEKNSQHL